MPDFIPGLRLSALFYRDVVRPLLDQHVPGLPHAAALVGSGSEVLGFDTPMSRDHHWGPRVMLFLSEADEAQHRASLDQVFRQHLPYSFQGYSTNFTAPNPEDNGTQLLSEVTTGDVNHRIEILSLPGFLRGELGVDLHTDLDAFDWLTFPSQQLRTITAGEVFHDDIGLNDLRRQLAFYPRDVWLALLASGWSRISQEEPFMGRTGDVGDELGSLVLAARLVRDIMRLCFLMERQYAPYAKWFGTAFARLKCAPQFVPHLEAAIRSSPWQEREKHLSAAYTVLAEMHNALGITEPLPTQVSSFHSRPYQVIHGDEFAGKIRAQISDPRLRHAASSIGSIDTFSDSTDLHENLTLRRSLKSLYLES